MLSVVVILSEVKGSRISSLLPQTASNAGQSSPPRTVSFELPELLAQRNIPSTFTREHDLILMAEPFALQDQLWTEAHTDRIEDAIARHFLHSAAILDNEYPFTACDRSCTDQLTYKLINRPEHDPVKPHAPATVLLTCAPRAHLALTNFLERGALFTVETVGRVACRSQT